MLSRTRRCNFRWAIPPPRNIHARHTSSTASKANLYPFPSNRNPSPYQIFHLPKNASEADIKQRYYELVRIYHPDKVGAGSLSAEAAHARFQSITAAYDALRGKTPLVDSPQTAQDTRYPTTAAWRARSRRQELYAGKDERWKDRVILFGVVAVFSTRKQALAEAVHRNRYPEAQQKKRAPVPVSSLDADDPDRRLAG
ncbi:hypothetical protein DXG03_000608 [Asterophora parasitica]|uniref:J domain-containing protein n=1 Tax=Asterophora parasitica TaxID=117018 RepID=A0A9P7GAB1_9AGAR|nr:hypothetical protein DXG03_000608 [Asterophora parasitica]